MRYSATYAVQISNGSRPCIRRVYRSGTARNHHYNNYYAPVYVQGICKFMRSREAAVFARDIRRAAPDRRGEPVACRARYTRYNIHKIIVRHMRVYLYFLYMYTRAGWKGRERVRVPAVVPGGGGNELGKRVEKKKKANSDTDAVFKNAVERVKRHRGADI